MKSVNISSLTEFLDRAVSSTTAISERGYGLDPVPIDIETYRAALLQSRTTYDQHLALRVRLLKPLMRDHDIKASLLEIIEQRFGEHIRDGHIQSATLAIGGGATGGFLVETLLNHWLQIAVVRGAGFAAQSFADSLRGTKANYQRMALLKGMTVDEEIVIGEGIRLIPPPQSVLDLPHYIPDLLGPSSLDLTDFTRRTLIVVDMTVAPVFINPQYTDTPNPTKAFSQGVRSREHPDFNMDEFCRALSLFTNWSITPAAWWSHADRDHFWNVETSFGHGYRNSATRTSYANFSHEQIRDSLDLYRAYRQIGGDTAARLGVAIDRWVKTIGDYSLADQFIDLGIALESLFIDDQAPEVRYRLSQRVGCYLGESPDGREAIARNLRQIYDRRSAAVHRGVVQHYENTVRLSQEARELTQRSLVKVIQDGGFPDWNKLVLGSL